MHFQPLEEISENLEESGNRHPNMALFNRLLNAAPSPTGFMGLHRTSNQLQRLHHSPGIDMCSTDDDDDDDDSCRTLGWSLPSGLGQDTQSTMCSFSEERGLRTPLLEIQFGDMQEEGAEHLTISEEEEVNSWRVERGEANCKGSLSVSRLPPPPSSTRPASTLSITSHNTSAFMFQPSIHSSLEHCSSQPAINRSRASTSHPSPLCVDNKMSFLTVPSYDQPQRFRSVSMDSEFIGA